MKIQGGVLIKATNADIAKDGTVNIPNSVTDIGAWAFYGCTSLTEIQLHDERLNVVCIRIYHDGRAAADNRKNGIY